MENLASIAEYEIIQTNFMAYIFILVCIIILVVTLILRRKKNFKITLSKKQENYTKLRAINFNNNDYKKIVYDFTILGKSCEVNELKDEFYNILENIEKYKYQKNLTKTDTIIDEKIITQMKKYIQKLGSYELV